MTKVVNSPVAFLTATRSLGRNLLVWVWLACICLARQVSVAASPAESWSQTFDMVWQTVRDKHFDTNYGGVDWNDVRQRYAPRVPALKSEAALYDLLREMLGELRQTHFGIVPPEAAPAAGAKSAVDGLTGLHLQILEGLPVITAVKPGSPAAKAGLKPGFVVRQIDGRAVADIIKPLAAGKVPPGLERFMTRRLIQHEVDGDAGTVVRLGILDGQGRVKEVNVRRVEDGGEMSLPLGNFPPQPLEFESRRLAGGIGYLRFNIFMVSQMAKIRAAIRSFGRAPGLIIDLRGNPGGLGGMAMGLGGLLLQEQVSLGTMQMRTGHINFVAYPQPEPFLGPLVILVDNNSASTSEIFAAGLQELGRATVVGEQTPGAALPSVFEKLPTGALFQYAFGDFKTPGGKLVEGNGVKPDREVKLSRAELLRGRDSQLEAAVQEIRARIRAGKR